MLYEFIATLSAGFALAGIALVIRHLAKLIFKITTPKWLTPLFAAIGIFAFQIHQEYNWYQQTVDGLPETTKVVKTVEGTSWYRPWTYVKPQIVRFMAVDSAAAASNTEYPYLSLVTLNLYERRISTKQIPQVIDCLNNKRADYTADENNNLRDIANLKWIELSEEDEILTAACK